MEGFDFGVMASLTNFLGMHEIRCSFVYVENGDIDDFV